jgi:hypothetical protein
MCNYECINTIGSYRCIESREIGADQPFTNNDFDDYITQHSENEDYRLGSDDTDGNYDIIDGVSVVSECLNGFYFNETIGNCLGEGLGMGRMCKHKRLSLSSLT